MHTILSYYYFCIFILRIKVQVENLGARATLQPFPSSALPSCGAAAQLLQAFPQRKPIRVVGNGGVSSFKRLASSQLCTLITQFI